MGICIGFYDENAKECQKCREKEVCEYIQKDPMIFDEVGKIVKKNRKTINTILKQYKQELYGTDTQE